MSELTIGTIEPQSLLPYELWRDYHLDDHASSDVVGLHDVRPFSPVMYSPMYPDTDTPRETTRVASVVSYHDDVDFNVEGDTTSMNASGDQGSATANPDHTSDLVQQSNARKRKAAETDKFSKRTKPRQGQTTRHRSESLQVESYIQMEKEKCERLGIPYNEQNCLSLSMMQWISTLDKVHEQAAVSMISTAIGSPESIALLQHVVVESRAKGRPTNPAERLAITDRVREIQHLSGQIAFIEFLRRCHVWKLYTDISQDIRAPDTGFVVVTSESMTRTRRAGNPKYSQYAEITKAMLCGLAPELETDSPEYKRQYQYASKLRTLGQRLELLTNTFGFGVLGLIPFQDHFESVDLSVQISDETYVPFICRGT
jgi:hypothetical protein